VAVNLTPNSEPEQAVFSAFTVLVQNRDCAAVSLSHLLTICKAAPDYTLKLLDANRTTLLDTSGSGGEEIANHFREVEWALRGASGVIGCDHFGSYDSNFLHEKLISRPHDFSREDLHTLIRQNPQTEDPIRISAVERLAEYVASFAERVAADPPGMSADIASLQRSINNYGFSSDLNEVLQKIDEELKKDADAFDKTATMKHIRSFFEKLHESVGSELQKKKVKVGNGTPLSKCGQAIDYLERKKVITSKLQALARSLYDILSDGTFGVHALKADRDYTRLCRNMVVEYAVTLFFELDRRLAQPGDT